LDQINDQNLEKDLILPVL